MFTVNKPEYSYCRELFFSAFLSFINFSPVVYDISTFYISFKCIIFVFVSVIFHLLLLALFTILAVTQQSLIWTLLWI